MSYIAAVDIGTTFLRCYIFDNRGNVRGSARCRVKLIYPAQGRVEIEPEDLWTSFVDVVKNAISDAKCTSSDIAALGISSLRATFINWDKETGKVFHNFITWQDTRASDYCKGWNESVTMKVMKFASKLLYFASRNKRYLAATVFNLKNAMVLPRMLWMIDNNAELRKRLDQHQVRMGCVETWLLWRLTGGTLFATDASFASSTGLYDPYVADWGYNILKVLGFPSHVLPDIHDTNSPFGHTDARIFGVRIPISALVADQQAAMFGCGCFERGAAKLCLSTGTFLDINTGATPHTSMEGLVPLVAWQTPDERTFTAEGFSHDTGTAIVWAQSVGLFENPADSAAIAESVVDSNGTYFVPAFSGLQAPVNDYKACTAFVGIRASTSKAHMTRAVLESLAFRAYQLYEVMLKEAEFPLTSIRITGGIANNDFVVQLIADLCLRRVERVAQQESSCVGVAMVAGLAVGFWPSRDEVAALFVRTSGTFEPRVDDVHQRRIRAEFNEWRRAVERCLQWYA